MLYLLKKAPDSLRNSEMSLHSHPLPPPPPKKTPKVLEYVKPK